MTDYNPGPATTDTPNIAAELILSGSYTSTTLPPANTALPGTLVYTSDLGLMVSSGTAWTAVSINSGAAGSSGVAQNAVNTYAIARTKVGSATGDTLYVFGRTSQSDGGQGLFTWVIGANIYGDSDLRLTSTGGYWQRVRYDQVFATANPVGINFAAGGGSALSFEGFPIFKNRMREGRGFTQTGATNVQTTLSADGWPTTDFACVLYEGNIIPSWLTGPGSFACGFLTTTGTETIVTGGGGTVSNIVRGAIGTYTTFDFLATAGFGFVITGTSGTTKNVFAFLPAYRSSAPAAGTSGPIDDPTTAAAFTNEAILHYSQFAYLRVMKYSYAEANVRVSTSANRRTPANTQSNPNTGLNKTPTFTANPGNAATSATLTANWPWPTGSYALCMPSADNAQARIASCTNGNTAVTWSPALTQASSGNYLVGNMSTEVYPIEWMVAFCNACNIGIWISTPMVEDGTNSSAGTWSSGVMDYLVSNWKSSGTIYFELANEIWNSDTAPFSILNGLFHVYGFADAAKYLAYLFHAFANLCRTKFPATFGTKVKQVLAWQSLNGAFNYINTILPDLALIGTPNADIQLIAIAPYVGPTVGNSDSIATIQAATAARGAIEALSRTAENIAIVGLRYGIPMCTYESGGQWLTAPVSQSNPNVGLAIMDSGMTAPLITYLQGLFNSGFTFISHFGSGVAAVSSNTSPTYELSNVYASPLSSPTLAALQSFMAGFTPTRNVVSGSGSVISGINYADNTASISNTPGTFNLGTLYSPYGINGYCPYLINCTAPGTYALTVNFTVSSGTPTTGLEANGVTLKSAVSVTTGNVALGNVTLSKGANYVLLGQSGSQANVAVNSLTFT